MSCGGLKASMNHLLATWACVSLCGHLPATARPGPPPPPHVCCTEAPVPVGLVQSPSLVSSLRVHRQIVSPGLIWVGLARAGVPRPFYTEEQWTLPCGLWVPAG